MQSNLHAPISIDKKRPPFGELVFVSMEMGGVEPPCKKGFQMNLQV